MDELFQKMCIRAAETIEQMVAARLQRFIERQARADIKVIFSESEAAKFLGISRDTLANWRRRGLIQYAQYPQAKADDLGDIFTYSAADLLSFREKYLRKTLAQNVYEIDPKITLAGPELRRVA